MPSRLTNAYTGIGTKELPIRTHGHSAGVLPNALFVIEGKECAFRAGRPGFACNGVGEIGKTGWSRRIEIQRSVGLDRYDERQIRPGRQRAGQPVWRDWRDANLSPARPIIIEE